jgi:hypothetical protein
MQKNDTVEVRAGSQVWRRYYVSPDGKRVFRKEMGSVPI